MRIDSGRECPLRIAVETTVLAILFLAGGAGAATNISECGTISTPGEYVENMNIIDSNASTCINITSSDVIFDGAGYTIDGIDAGGTYGVYVYNPTTALTNVTVKNLRVTDWDYGGIYYLNASNGSIVNNNASSNGNGIVLHSFSNGNTLADNFASSNGFGIWLHSSSSNIVIRNNASLNSIGIYPSYGSYYNTIANNIAYRTDNRGCVGLSHKPH